MEGNMNQTGTRMDVVMSKVGFVSGFFVGQNLDHVNNIYGPSKYEYKPANMQRYVTSHVRRTKFPDRKSLR